MKGRYSCLPFRAASAGLVLMGCKQPLPIVPPTLTITSHKNGPVVHTQAVATDSDGSTGKATITVAAGNVPEPTYTSGPVLTIVNPGAEQFATLMS